MYILNISSTLWRYGFIVLFAVRPVVDLACRDLVPHGAITVGVQDRADRPVDR